METKTLVSTHDTIPPGRSLHFVFQTLGKPVPLEVSVVDRPDLEAEAVLDKDGWVVILLTNTTDIPVTITPLEPLQLVILPRNRQQSLR